MTTAQQVPRDLITCGHCQKQIRDPKQLPCLHTFCSVCVSEISLQSCPACGFSLSSVGDSQTFPSDIFINSLLELSLNDHPTAENATQERSQLFQTTRKDCEKNLEALLSRSDDLCKTVMVARQQLSTEKLQASDAVGAYFADLRTRLNDYVTKQEKTILSDLEQICNAKAKECDQIREWSKSIQQTTGDYNQLLDATNANTIKENEEACCKVMREMNMQVRNFEHRTEKETEKISQPVSLQFVPNPDAERGIMSRSLGYLKTNVEVKKETSPLAPKPKPMDPDIVYNYAILQRRFSTRFPDDVRGGYVVGLAWVPPDHLLAVDKWNNRLKLFHENGESLFCVNLMGGEPTDVAYTKSLESGNRHFCVVALPSSCAIAQVIIENDRLLVTKQITTAVGYTSLAYDKLNAQLVCGVCPPFGQPRVDIIMANGTILKSFAVDRFGMPLFSSPRSIDVDDEGRIVVCDWKRNHLVFLASDGLILGSYKGTLANHLVDPIGTSVDNCGHVLVADMRARCIKFIDFAGDFRCKLEIDELNFTPREINLCRAGNEVKLAVSQNEGMVSWYTLYTKEDSDAAI